MGDLEGKWCEKKKVREEVDSGVVHLQTTRRRMRKMAIGGSVHTWTSVFIVLLSVISMVSVVFFIMGQEHGIRIC